LFQLITVTLSFVLVPILGRFKVGLWASLVITAIVMGLINGLGIADLAEIVGDVFTAPASMNAILTIAMVSVMGAMMKVYGVLDKGIAGLASLVSDKRYLIAIIPLLIGCIAVPGGAILSAPFILNLGNELGMEKPLSAVSNLVFRHMPMFLLPYSTSILVASSITNLSIMTFIPLNAIFILPVFFSGYFIYMRRVPAKKNEDKVPFAEGMKNLLKYTSPIYVCVIVHIVTGIPFYLAMISSLLILFMMSPDKKGYPKLFIKSVCLKTVFSAVGVFMIQGVVSNLDGLIAVFSTMMESGALMILALFLAAVFFGMITGFHMASIGFVIPMIMTLDLSHGEFLALLYFVYCAAYFGYYFSPLHMCQIFTNQYMDVKMKSLYRVYIPFASFVLGWMVVSYLALSQILPMMFG